ncbi:MAG: hypothetical protein ACTHLZ_17360 [Tepidisphaeraceae bacterium]
MRLSALVFHRLFRHLFSCCALISAAVFLFTGVIWVHSYWHTDFVNFQYRPRHNAQIFTSVEANVRSGQLQFIFQRDVWKSTIPDGYFLPSEWQLGTDGSDNLASIAAFHELPGPVWGIGHVVDQSRGSSNFFSAGWITSQVRSDCVYVPIALVWALAAVLPVIWFVTRIRRRRRVTASF